MKSIYSSSIVTLCLFFAGHLAHAEFGCHDDHDIASALGRFRPQGRGGAQGEQPPYRGAQPPAQVLQCGQTVTSSVTMAADLNCPATTGFALNVVGSNIVVSGGGHKIFAPLAAAGLFAQGSGITIENFNIGGVTGGDGILAYDTPNVLIQNNVANGNEQGIVVYSDTSAVFGVQVVNNTATGNSLFGVRTGYDAPGALVSPLISGNNLANSGSYGMLVEATQFDLGGAQANVYAGSLNGIYLTGGTANVHGIAISQDKVTGVGIFAANLQSLTISNIDVSSLVPANSNQDRIGVDMYRVASFSLSGLNCNGNDVGVKLETELGVSPAGTITASQFWNNDVSGILLVSYDGSPYGRLDFTRNCYQSPVGAVRVLAEPGVTYAAGSVLDDALNACSAGGGSCFGYGR